MTDGGAGSKDAFRIPQAGEELTYPFSQFVVRYGHTARLAKKTAATAGVTADMSPPMEVNVLLHYDGAASIPRTARRSMCCYVLCAAV